MINFDQIPRSQAGYSVIATICSNGNKLPLLLFKKGKEKKAVKKVKKKKEYANVKQIPLS